MNKIVKWSTAKKQKDVTVHVCVREQDIQDGLATSPLFCPVAIALHRALGDWESDVRVGAATAYLRVPDGEDIIRMLPYEAMEFIERFDRHRAVTPFKFKLSVPRDWQKVGTK